MAGEIGEAFVRIRPNLSGFKAEVEAGVRQATRGLGGAGLSKTSADFGVLSTQTRRAGASAVAASEDFALLGRRASTTATAEARAARETATFSTRAAASARQLNTLERGALAGSGAFRGLGRSIAFASLSFVGAYGFVGAVKGALSAVDDLNTQTARSVTVFGASAGAIQTWARDASAGLGFARSSALEVADSFGSILRAAGLGGRQLVSFAEDFSKVAAAISLARGEADPEKATKALEVAIAGRGRALRQYGILLTEASIKQKALDLGLVPKTVDAGKVALDRRRLAEATAELAAAEAKYAANSVQVARAQDAVTSAQRTLRKDVAGTTGELTAQQKAVAAHAIVMEQGRRFVERYGASLETAAGRSRRFHEGIAELQEELGIALYPAFTRAAEGVVAYVRSLREGGSRHAEFESDLRVAAQLAADLYEGLRLLAAGFRELSSAVGGAGNLVEIVGFGLAAKKVLELYEASVLSRAGLLLLGRQATATAATTVAAEEAIGDGAVVMGGKLAGARASAVLLLGSLGRLARIGTIAVVIDLIINKEDRDNVLEALKHPGRTIGAAARSVVGADRPVPSLNLGQRLGLPGFSAHPGHGAAPGRYKQIRDAGNGPAATRAIMRAEGYTANEVQGAELQYQFTSGHGLTIRGGPDPEGVHPQIHARDAFRAPAVEADAAAAGKRSGLAFTSGLASSLRGIRSQLADVNREIAQAVADGARQMAEAAQQAAEAERDAVLSAKQNLLSLGGSLADTVNQFLDARGSAGGDDVDPNSRLGRKLRRLNELIREGKGTPALVRQAERVQNELDARAAGGGDDEEKKRVSRRLADLSALFDAGKIGVARFNREVNALLRREGINYRSAGQALGFAFAQGFRQQVRELLGQAAAIGATPAGLRRQGTGFEGQVVRPTQVIAEQTRNLAAIARDQRSRLGDLYRQQASLLAEARAAGGTAKDQRRTIIGELRRGGARGGGAASGGGGRPGPSIAEALLREVVAVGRREVAAEGDQADLLRRGEGAAERQRGALIAVGRGQQRTLDRIARQGDEQTGTLRGIERELRRRPPVAGTRPSRAAELARQAAQHDLN